MARAGDARTERMAALVDDTLVAEAASGGLAGQLTIGKSSYGVGELGMLVAKPWRGRGVGSALLAASIDRGRADGLHKLALDVFPHNDGAIALYRKFGFVEEGRRVKHYRRASGELWDSIVKGLML